MINFVVAFSMSMNLYVYVGNNPLKYIDPTGRVKVVPFDMDLEDYEIDILSPIEGSFDPGERLQALGSLWFGESNMCGYKIEMFYLNRFTMMFKF
jgi:hypothetical protein